MAELFAVDQKFGIGVDLDNISNGSKVKVGMLKNVILEFGLTCTDLLCHDT